MEEIRGWAFGICAAAIACGMIQLILPKSGTQRIFQLTASVFFLCCLLSPLALSLPSMGDFTAGQEEMQAEVERRSKLLEGAVEERGKTLAVESIRGAAADTLEEMGIPYRKIYVNVHDDANNSISISECEVELDRRYMERHDEIRAALMKKLGVNVLIGYKE